MEFRKLKANEIQVRPTDTKNRGRATLLLYQDARCAMDILDDTVGNENWQKEYYEVNGNVYCRIGIFTENGWTWKSDCGTESNVDAEKGQATDAFKRAAVCWGIGRELYATPKIKINCPDRYYYNDKMTMTFTVTDIEWDDRELKSLVIVDRFGTEVYRFKPAAKEEVTEDKSNIDILKSFCSDMKTKDGVDIDDLARFYRWYEKRVTDWENALKPEMLWNRWKETKK